MDQSVENQLINNNTIESQHMELSEDTPEVVDLITFICCTHLHRQLFLWELN